MHYHLDLLGGLAGDMFAAAMLDCHPEWQAELCEAVTASQLVPGLAVAGALLYRRFVRLVRQSGGERSEGGRPDRDPGRPAESTDWSSENR